MLRLLKILDEICRENNIEYWIDCGTLLGAVRHQGFIPWDDDLDISVPADQYHKLLDILHEKSLTDESMFLFYYKSKTAKYWCEYIGSTLFITGGKACKVDIFPMKFIDGKDQKKDDIITYRANYFCTGNTLKNTKYIKEFKLWIEKEFISAAHFMDYYNDEYMPSCNHKKADSLLIYPFGTYDNPKRQYHLYTDVFPLKEIEFEGCKFFSPNNAHQHLIKNYGDYMKLPPKSKQKPVAKKFFSCSNVETVKKLTSERSVKKLPVVYFFTTDIIKKYPNATNLFLGSKIKTSLVEISCFYVDSNCNIKKAIKDNIDFLFWNFEPINLKILLYYFRYKIKYYFYK